MKIQSLAIMFIILILPISMVLASYTQSRVETLSLQSKYDSKLKDATYDALKAYQLNSLNSDTSDYANSKIRDIKASVNTFFNSIATNFSTIGYTKETLQNYIPAVVYTMYDGYYIYSPYTNTWDEETNDKFSKEGSYSSYEPNKELYGLKPYVYYSCRYKKTNIDVVITYSLDNYITIQGMINGNPVNESGYLLSYVKNQNGIITYKGIEINSENAKNLKENVIIDGEKKTLSCIKKNGTKYYLDGDEVFSVLNGKKIKQSGITKSDFENYNNAVKYYEEAIDLKNFIKTNGLEDLKVSDAVDIDGYEFLNNPYQNLDNGKIFDFDHSEGIEASDSNFNTHRRDVIKYSIERNLSIAISNYNNYSAVTGYDFQMPKLKETDWDKIMDNISIISFMQGINIGGKVYNGYSVISNTKNTDVVTEDSIYIKNGENIISRVTESGLTGGIGILNVNLERRTGENENGTIYFFPIEGTLSYDSIVTQSKIDKDYKGNIYDYLSEKTNLAKIYFTALARERYGMYRPVL